MKDLFIEIIAYVMALILLFAFIVWINGFVNRSKIAKCEESGGTIILNTTNAEITSCAIPPKK